MHQHALSPSEKAYVTEGVRLNCRSDGRSRAAFRPVSVTTGALQQANGSARVRLAGSSLTEVIAAVKVRIILCGRGRS